MQLAQDRSWLVLERPTTVLSTSCARELPHVIDRAEQLAVSGGCHVVGFVTYEASAAFGLCVQPSLGPLPLAWFAAFPSDRAHIVPRLEPAGIYDVGTLTPSLSREAFADAFHAIKSHLVAGDTYQVNQTFFLNGAFTGSAEALFADLVRSQGGDHAFFLETADWCICSASPELFFARNGADVVMRPMKGTAPRGRTAADDVRAREALLTSPKQQAENVMIVDMVRNDLGRVAVVGSVHVPQLFTAERYPSVWQMTSTVTARTTASLSELFAALHPCASVTGAPKPRTMELLTDLELQPRGVYTGAIGYIAPGGAARFNVAIRTALIDRVAGRLQFGIGSGIVWDSDVDEEYDECLLKGRVLTARSPEFDLLETLRWAPREGFTLLDRHMTRLERSAEYFEFSFNRDVVLGALDDAVAGQLAPRRVRLTLTSEGRPIVEHRPLDPTRPLRVAIAAVAVEMDDVFLFHKTTRRDVYQRATLAGYDDVILWNARGEVTESTVGNVVIEWEGRRVTPPVSCGLLPGTFREQLLAEGEVEERVVSVPELLRLGRCWIVNSVHGWRQAQVVSSAAPAVSSPGVERRS